MIGEKWGKNIKFKMEGKMPSGDFVSFNLFHSSVPHTPNNNKVQWK
jgi:hypothetical protein